MDILSLSWKRSQEGEGGYNKQNKPKTRKQKQKRERFPERKRKNKSSPVVHPLESGRQRNGSRLDGCISHIATHPFSTAFKNSCSQTATHPSSSLP
jgi:hypothetical protein